MPLNQEGIELLKADLRAMATSYRQGTFGSIVEECRTEQCMAGICRIREIGYKAYLKEVRTIGNSEDFADICILSGAKQLGIDLPDEDMPDASPQIFAIADAWPKDLKEPYYKAKSPQERAEAACAALDRLQEDGSISYL